MGLEEGKVPDWFPAILGNMRQALHVLILGLVALILASCYTRPVRSNYPGYHQREASIKEELRTIDGHAWAGEYKSPPGMTTHVVFLSPEGGWAHYQWSCTHDSCSHGRILVDEDKLVFANPEGRELSSDELEREIFRPLEISADLWRIRAGAEGAGERADRLDGVLQLLREQTRN